MIEFRTGTGVAVVVEGADLLVKLGDLRMQFEGTLVGFVIKLHGFAERDDPCLLGPDFPLQGLDLGGVEAALFGELFFKNAGKSMAVVLDGFQVLAVRLGEVGVELFEVISGDASATGEGGFHDRQLPCQLVELLSQGPQLGAEELLFLTGLAVGIEQVKIGLSMDTRCLSLRFSELTLCLVAFGLLGEFDVVRVLALRHRIERIDLTAHSCVAVLDFLNLRIRTKQPQ